MGAVVCSQLYGGQSGRSPDEAPGAVASATEGSVSAQVQLPEIGTSAFASMLLASPRTVAAAGTAADLGLGWPVHPEPPLRQGAALMPGLFRNKLPGAEVRARLQRGMLAARRRHAHRHAEEPGVGRLRRG